MYILGLTYKYIENNNLIIFECECGIITVILLQLHNIFCIADLLLPREHYNTIDNNSINIIQSSVEVFLNFEGVIPSIFLNT